jgi:hypothetical protein
MEFLEKDLEQIIYETSSDLLESKGLEVCGKRYRQLRIGAYGIADLVTVELTNYLIHQGSKLCLIITVYELKKERAGISAFLQAVRYVKGISQYLNKRNLFNITLNVFYKIVIIGKEIEINSDYIFLTDFLYYDYPNSLQVGRLIDLNNYSYRIDINGLQFKHECNYHLENGI